MYVDFLLYFLLQNAKKYGFYIFCLEYWLQHKIWAIF